MKLVISRINGKKDILSRLAYNFTFIIDSIPWLKSPKNFIELSNNEKFDDLLNIDGIGDTQIKSLKIFFSNSTNLKVINELQKNLSIQNDLGVRKDGLLKEKTFMFTGKLTGISRAEAKSLIEENSGSIISNVSKKLDYLIKGGKIK